MRHRSCGRCLVRSDGELLPPGATPLDPDEADGLLQVHVETRRELNEAEEANITAGLAWALLRLRRHDPLSDEFVYELHRRMFDKVWAWAGQTRITEKNIGVAPWEIRPRVRDLLADARLWRDAWKAGQPIYPVREACVRLHHRLVAIHPFANGNGRHARMMADLWMLQSGEGVLSWGRGIGSLVSTGALRDQYITALRAADRGDMGPLLRFAES